MIASRVHAGLGVNFKRKVSYKNTHKRELVDVNRIFKALEYLIEHNPLYKDSEIDRDFLNSCKETDPAGHDFFIDPESSDQNISSPQLESDDDELFRNINSQGQPMSAAMGGGGLKGLCGLGSGGAADTHDAPRYTGWASGAAATNKRAMTARAWGRGHPERSLVDEYMFI